MGCGNLLGQGHNTPGMTCDPEKTEGSAMEYPDKYVASSLVFNPANFECHDFFVIFSTYRTPELWKLPVLMSHPSHSPMGSALPSKSPLDGIQGSGSIQQYLWVVPCPGQHW